MSGHPKPELQPGFASVAISDSVSYQWLQTGSGRLAETLAASGRWYPGLRHGRRFLAGLHRPGRFLPGVIWAGRFVPGLLMRGAFVPGIAVGDTFTPGIVATGVFVPGVIHRDHFAPGIVGQGRFLPGCFTAARRFAPGRLVAGRFEAGLFRGNAFESDPDLEVDADQAQALADQGEGLAALARDVRVGGLPVRGVVLGSLAEALVHVPLGLATSQGVVLGGLSRSDDLTTVNPRQRLGIFGFECDDPNAPEHLLGTEGLVERIERSLEELLPGNRFGAGRESVMGDLAGAMDQLAQGSHGLIDSLNREWADYWTARIEGHAGGVIAGSDAGASTGGRVVGGMIWAIAGAGSLMQAIESGAAIGAVIGGGIGAFVGGFVAGLLALLGLAGDAQQKVESNARQVDAAVTEVQHQVQGGSGQKEPPKGGPGSQPGDGGGDAGHDRGFVGHPARPIRPYIDRRRTLIEFDHGEGDAFARADLQRAPVRIVHTDTGAMMVVDFEALRRAMVSNPDRRVVVALNAVTGSAIYLPGPIEWSEVQRQSQQWQWWLDRYGHPVQPGEWS